LHIILVSNRLAKARTFTLTPRRLLLAVFGLILTVLTLSTLVSYITVRHAADIRLPLLKDIVRLVTLEDSQRSQEYLKENLRVMAVKLGEMQAQMMRLDSLSARLADMTGIRPQEVSKPEPGRDGRGGPLLAASDMNESQLQAAVDAMTAQVENRTDILSVIESRLFEERVRKNLLPTSLPVDVQWNASAFGWRIDPFTGQRAMHEGVDFPAEVGTPIKAAAAGVVVNVEHHSDYGNVVEIDHGNDLTTRYAHASKALVKVGDVVKRGQLVAEVGSTGRSTGPHLHFEVRFKGAAQNPNQFLNQARANTYAHR
jgi:murein DD-endopeptidase MepM/ murein hydrolase activator NlpD